jgi:hypothetical protein
MNLKQFVKNLQHKPLQTRVRILWGVTGVIGLALIVLFFTSLGNNINKLNSSDFDFFQDNNNNESAVASNNHIQVEWVERGDGKTKIFFKITNNTSTILNFSKLTDVTLKYRDIVINAQQLTNRQGSPFDLKMLSRSESYGIAIFEDVDVDEVVLKFDQLFFENQDQLIFSEELPLNLKELNKSVEIRS